MSNSLKKHDKTSSKAQMVIAEQFSGPIPSPEVFAKYEAILPGAAERILTMAEEQQKHRMEIEKQVINSKISDSRLGIILGFILTIVIIAVSTGAILMGYSVIGFSSIIIAVGGLVGVFIYGTRSNRKEREKHKG
nr:MAG TPA: putative membrane protein [Caudoviricetes sp.]